MELYQVHHVVTKMTEIIILWKVCLSYHVLGSAEIAQTKLRYHFKFSTELAKST
jgi:hypothetical protein